MHKVKIKDFQAVDALNFKFRDKEELYNILSRDPEYFQTIYNLCPNKSYSILRDDKIVAITFWTEDICGVASMCFFACENFEKFFDGNVLRALRKILEQVKFKYSRIQATCTENKRNKRFLEFLGFKQEALMHKAGFDSSDLYVYSIVQ